MKKQFLCNVPSNPGIGNRIHVVINGFRIAKEYYNTQLCINWEKKIYNFEDLFEINDNFNVISSDEVINNDKYIVSNINGDICDKMRNKYFIPNKDNIIFCNNIGFIIFEHEKSEMNNVLTYKNYRYTLSYAYDRTPEYFRNKYSEYFEYLQPSKKIMETSNEFVNSNFSSYTVGIHIRLGDKIRYIKSKNNICTQYYKYIDDELLKNADTKFYVTCDEKFGYDNIMDKYKNTTFKYEHNDATDQSDEYTALVCMMILAKCNKIICMCGSTFSEISWWYSKCKEIIVITKDM